MGKPVFQQPVNWAKGLDRLFNVVWALIAFLGLWALIETGPTLSKTVAYGVLALIVPQVLKLAITWVVKGFQE